MSIARQIFAQLKRLQNEFVELTVNETMFEVLFIVRHELLLDFKCIVFLLILSRLSSFTMFTINYMDVVYFHYFYCDFKVFYPAGAPYRRK